MRAALFSTLCTSFSRVFYKKALHISQPHHISLYAFAIFGMFGSLAVCVIYLLGGFVQIIDLLIHWKYILMILGAVLLAVCYRPLNIQIYQEEKLATILPYTNLNKIFSLVISFFLFKDASLISLLIALLAVGVIIGFSIDLKHASFPKNFLKILGAQVMVSLRYILMSRCVLEISDRIFYVYDVIIYTVILIGIILTTRVGPHLLHAGGKPFYMNRLGASVMGAISTVLALYLITEVGATIVILLGFLEIGLVMLMGFFYLHEKPTKKDILLTVMVTVLVAVGFFLR